MKKIFVVSLSILCMCCIAIGLTGCKKDKHIHAFDKQVITDEYKATDATCTEKATYYYSCECGEKGKETFEYGSTTNHNFVNGSCTYCGKKQETSRGLVFRLLDDGTYEVSRIGSCTDTEIVIPSVYNDKPVTSIGKYAFNGCSKLMSVTIPDSVTSIGESAFDGCSGLTSVTIGNSVTSIGRGAFYGCSGLTSVTIGNSVTSIGGDAFGDCGGIESLVVTAGNKKYYNANNCIIETGTKQLIVGCKTSIIPSDGSVTSIGYGAFNGCHGLTSVTIPDSVTSIGGQAFDRCSGLTSVTIPDRVTSIGDCAFEGCSGLTSVTIGNSVTSIGNRAFSYCSGIESLVVTEGNKKYHSANNCIIETGTKQLIVGCKTSIIPSDGSVTSIGNYAFNGCRGLTRVTIPDSVTSIGEGVFDYSGLTRVTIGNSVTSIGVGAFYGSRLMSITYKGTIADWKNIDKGFSWNSEVPRTCVIHCTDGNIGIYE